MPTPSEDKSKPGQDLPRPELSPTHNPLLERNLGRWAEVYFTTPPDQREQAVEQLLHELEGNLPVTQPPAASGGVPVGESAGKTEQEPLVCPACRYQYKLGQHFCGACGAPLQEKETSLPPADTHAAATTSVPSPEREPQDWQWLHQRHLADLRASQERSHAWKYVVVATLLLLGGVTFLVWYTRWRAPIRLPAATAPAVSSPSASPASQFPPAGANHPESGTAARSTTETLPAPADDQHETNAAGQSSSADGSEELVVGRRYLNGQGVPEDHATAARWLWRAVAKQNADAVLLLSDMYLRGDGVPQSCAQARVLLTAAANRGSAQANSKLGSLPQAGCP